MNPDYPDKSKSELLSRFEELRPLYLRLNSEMEYAVSKYLAEEEIEYAEILGRVKSSQSFLEKIERKNYNDPLLEMDDLSGIRVVCLFDPDLERVVSVLSKKFSVIRNENKTEELGVSVMGYQGRHVIAKLGPDFRGPRYDQISALKCEIQVRTVLQDAWSKLSHKLVYKNEASIPKKLRRSLNNVSSLMEIAQTVFDSVRVQQQSYVTDLSRKVESHGVLGEPIDHHTVKVYTQSKFPRLPVSEIWQSALIDDLDHQRYKVISDIDLVVNRAANAIVEFAREDPEKFEYGTDFITKSLGLVDEAFLSKHQFSSSTVKKLILLRKKHQIATVGPT